MNRSLASGASEHGSLAIGEEFRNGNSLQNK